MGDRVLEGEILEGEVWVLRDVVDDEAAQLAENPDAGVVGAEVEDVQGGEALETGEVLHEKVLWTVSLRFSTPGGGFVSGAGLRMGD